MMEPLYHQTKKLIEQTQNYFIKLECDDFESVELEKEIEDQILQINRNCEKLDILAYKEPLPRRQASKSRVDQLKYDYKFLQGAYKMLLQKKKQQKIQMQEREELLQRKFTTLRDEDETRIFIDHSLEHQNALQRTNRNLDDIILTGTGVLESLREQQVTLKGAQKKLIDLANTLGLSNTTVRLIENRVKEDKWILLGGMFITMLIIFLVIIYVKK